MKKLTIQELSRIPGRLEEAAGWFSQKWGIPARAYRESMEDSFSKEEGFPRWYLVLEENGQIAAGAGVIENDFHSRKDLSPNLCALFVEEGRRRQGVASRLLDFIRKDFARMGYKKLYLVTDHTEFYEKCGWRFLTMALDDAGEKLRLYEAEL